MSNISTNSQNCEVVYLSVMARFVPENSDLGHSQAFNF